MAMTKQEVRRWIEEIGIVPVVRAQTKEHAIAAAEAAAAGGVTVVEITMTCPDATAVIADLVRSGGSRLLVGAGTVLDVNQARQCLDAGAEFLVSPGLDIETVKFAQQQGKLMMAGALTPTEVITAWKAGTDIVKIFPCGNVGGAKYIKALKGPLPQVHMVPTGGVNLDTAAEFIKAGAVALGVGGELVSPSALASGEMAEITRLAQQFISIVRSAREPQLATASR
jgi:2-dehydro-3-deoxyphosphogluconate aldolase/(4S)-4-hydroxy-2-oxoglutarate aldolase